VRDVIEEMVSIKKPFPSIIKVLNTLSVLCQYVVEFDYDEKRLEGGDIAEKTIFNSVLSKVDATSGLEVLKFQIINA